MSEPALPNLQDLLDAFERLADRVAAAPGSRLDPFVSNSLRRATEELRRFIPGLDAPPDPDAARFLVRAAYAALEDGDSREALARALRGLSFSPHHPGLFYAAASACFEYGAVEDAIRLLRHTLWIHPGHTAARRDLDSLSAYMRERWESPEARAAQQEAYFRELERGAPDPSFDLEYADGDAAAFDEDDAESSLDDDEDERAA